MIATGVTRDLQGHRTPPRSAPGILQYGTGLSIAIIGFAIWLDLTRMQLLNYVIKTRPMVIYVTFHDKIMHNALDINLRYRQGWI